MLLFHNLVLKWFFSSLCLEEGNYIVENEELICTEEGGKVSGTVVFSQLRLVGSRFSLRSRGNVK